MIRPASPTDAPAIIALAESAAMFDEDGLALVAETLDGHPSDTGALWFVADEDGVVGVVYAIQEPMADRVWNVLMLIVSSGHYGQGVGKTLMAHVEEAVVERGARLLVVETSGTDGYDRARSLYAACGFDEEARIRDFYEAGDDKIVFTKSVAA